MAFTQVQTGKPGGYNEILKAVNDNFAAVETDYLTEITSADLPIGGTDIGGVKNGGNVEIKASGVMDVPTGGALLGLVKNGGNVTIQSDGTMTAPTPEDGIDITRTAFTEGDARWSGVQTNGVYLLTLPNAGATCFGVFMAVGSGGTAPYIVPVVDVEVGTTNTIIKSVNKFAGFILQGVVA